MIDADDVGNAGLFGGILLFIIFLVIYLVWSVPEIKQCHKDGGVIVRIEGNDKCVEPPVEIKK
jgi:hypothetical protein